MYLLDTNIISYWMRGVQSLMDKIKSHSPSELSLSTITLAEILYGIEKSSTKKKSAAQKSIAYALNLTSIPLMNRQQKNTP